MVGDGWWLRDATVGGDGCGDDWWLVKATPSLIESLAGVKVLSTSKADIAGVLILNTFYAVIPANTNTDTQY